MLEDGSILFGVFDGHTTDTFMEFEKEKLMPELKRRLEEKPLKTAEAFDDMHYETKDEHEVMVMIEVICSKARESKNHTGRGGSTYVIGYINPSGSTLYVANGGDSRSIAVTEDDDLFDITPPHDASNVIIFLYFSIVFIFY